MCTKVWILIPIIMYVMNLFQASCTHKTKNTRAHALVTHAHAKNITSMLANLPVWWKYPTYVITKHIPISRIKLLSKQLRSKWIIIELEHASVVSLQHEKLLTFRSWQLIQISTVIHLSIHLYVSLFSQSIVFVRYAPFHSGCCKFCGLCVKITYKNTRKSVPSKSPQLSQAEADKCQKY